MLPGQADLTSATTARAARPFADALSEEYRRRPDGVAPHCPMPLEQPILPPRPGSQLLCGWTRQPRPDVAPIPSANAPTNEHVDAGGCARPGGPGSDCAP